MAIWTPPVVYDESTIVGKDLLNAQFSENMRYLFNRNKAIATIGGTGVQASTASTTFIPVDPILDITILTYAQSNHLLWFQGMTRQTGNAYGETMFDVYDDSQSELIANDKYGATSGLCRMGVRYSTSTYRTQSFEFVYPNRPAGVYRYILYWRDDGSGGVSELNTNAVCQFGVREV